MNTLFALAGAALLAVSAWWWAVEIGNYGIAAASAMTAVLLAAAWWRNR